MMEVPRKERATMSANGDRRKEASLKIDIVIGSVFLLFSILLYLPATIYLSNANEFTLHVPDLALIFLPAFVFSLATLVTLVLVMPRSIKPTVVSLLFAVGAMVWMQGNLLVWDYGIFDGREINWGEHWVKGLVDGSLWVAMIAIALWIPYRFVEIGRIIAVVIVLIQGAALSYSASMEMAHPGEASARSFSIDGSNKYVFSAQSNAVVIVLDAFQSDVFWEIVSREPQYASPLDGFTYFRDAVAASNFTELAVPALLTGVVYDNSRPRSEYLREAYTKDSIMVQLRDRGFTTEIYPWVGWGNESMYFDEAIASNLKKIDAAEAQKPTLTEKKGKEALHLLDLAIFRAAPHFAKPLIHNDQRWLVGHMATLLVPASVKHAVSSEDQFSIGRMIKDAPPELTITQRSPVFKYFHFSGVHSPLSVNEDLEFTDHVYPFSRSNYVNQAKANLLALERLIGKLRNAGIYDNTLLAIVGDHGSGESAEMYIEPPGASREPYRLGGSMRNFRRDKARAIPLVLIKPIGAVGPLRVSEAPVSLTDLPATVMAELGYDSHLQRPSMFDVDPSESRVRLHRAIEFNPNKSEYVGDTTVYQVVGDSWMNGSWSVLEVLHPPAGAGG